MKKPIGIFLLLVILFNAVGHYGVLILMEHQLTARMIEKIDENETRIGASLMLTFPIETPYATDTENYERVDGQVMFEGHLYRKVKQKRHDHVLYVMCIRDNKAGEVKSLDAFVRTVTDQEQGKSGADVKVVVSLAKYCLLSTLLPNPGLTWSHDVSFRNINATSGINIACAVFHPPKAA